MAFIVDSLLFSPLKFTIWLADKLRENAFQELTDDAKVHEQLLQLQMRYEMGEIDDDAYETEENQLLEQLERIRQIKEER
jgi:hypothetical protein